MTRTAKLATIDACREIPFRAHPDVEGTLVALTAEREVPFPIARLFYVFGAPPGAVRGEHAHIECQQLLVCLSGAVEIRLDDGVSRRTVLLDSPARGLHVPAGIWASQTYRARGTVLAVIADRPYDEKDYLRDYDAFLRFRGVARGRAVNG